MPLSAGQTSPTGAPPSGTPPSTTSQPEPQLSPFAPVQSFDEIAPCPSPDPQHSHPPDYYHIVMHAEQGYPNGRFDFYRESQLQFPWRTPTVEEWNGNVEYYSGQPDAVFSRMGGPIRGVCRDGDLLLGTHKAPTAVPAAAMSPFTHQENGQPYTDIETQIAVCTAMPPNAQLLIMKLDPQTNDYVPKILPLDSEEGKEAQIELVRHLALEAQGRHVETPSVGSPNDNEYTTQVIPTFGSRYQSVCRVPASALNESFSDSNYQIYFAIPNAQEATPTAPGASTTGRDAGTTDAGGAGDAGTSDAGASEDAGAPDAATRPSATPAAPQPATWTSITDASVLNQLPVSQTIPEDGSMVLMVNANLLDELRELDPNILIPPNPNPENRGFVPICLPPQNEKGYSLAEVFKNYFKLDEDASNDDQIAVRPPTQEEYNTRVRPFLQSVGYQSISRSNGYWVDRYNTSELLENAPQHGPKRLSPGRRAQQQAQVELNRAEREPVDYYFASRSAPGAASATQTRAEAAQPFEVLSCTASYNDENDPELNTIDMRLIPGINFTPALRDYLTTKLTADFQTEVCGMGARGRTLKIMFDRGTLEYAIGQRYKGVVGGIEPTGEVTPGSLQDDINNNRLPRGVTRNELINLKLGLVRLLKQEQSIQGEIQSAEAADQMKHSDNLNIWLTVVSTLALLGTFVGLEVYRVKGESWRARREGRKALSRFGVNLNDLYRNKPLTIEFESILTDLKKMRGVVIGGGRGAILWGDPGVGKTLRAMALAIGINNGMFPELAGCEVWELDLAALEAGGKYRGVIEERWRAIKQRIQNADPSKPLLLFIDEIHRLAGIGRAEGVESIIEDMKATLTNPEYESRFRLFGTTNTPQLAEFRARNEAFVDRLLSIEVHQPSYDSTLKILEKLMPELRAANFRFPAIEIPNEVWQRIVQLADERIPERSRPRKSIDVVREVISWKRINSIVLKNDTWKIDQEQCKKITLEDVERFFDEHYPGDGTGGGPDDPTGGVAADGDDTAPLPQPDPAPGAARVSVYGRWPAATVSYPAGTFDPSLAPRPASDSETAPVLVSTITDNEEAHASFPWTESYDADECTVVNPYGLPPFVSEANPLAASWGGRPAYAYATAGGRSEAQEFGVSRRGEGVAYRTAEAGFYPNDFRPPEGPRHAPESRVEAGNSAAATPASFLTMFGLELACHAVGIEPNTVTGTLGFGAGHYVAVSTATGRRLADVILDPAEARKFGVTGGAFMAVAHYIVDPLTAGFAKPTTPMQTTAYSALHIGAALGTYSAAEALGKAVVATLEGSGMTRAANILRFLGSRAIPAVGWALVIKDALQIAPRFINAVEAGITSLLGGSMTQANKNLMLAQHYMQRGDITYGQARGMVNCYNGDLAACAFYPVNSEAFGRAMDELDNAVIAHALTRRAELEHLLFYSAASDLGSRLQGYNGSTDPSALTVDVNNMRRRLTERLAAIFASDGYPTAPGLPQPPAPLSYGVAYAGECDAGCMGDGFDVPTREMDEFEKRAALDQLKRDDPDLHARLMNAYGDAYSNYVREKSVFDTIGDSLIPTLNHAFFDENDFARMASAVSDPAAFDLAFNSYLKNWWVDELASTGEPPYGTEIPGNFTALQQAINDRDAAAAATLLMTDVVGDRSFSEFYNQLGESVNHQVALKRMAYLMDNADANGIVDASVEIGTFDAPYGKGLLTSAGYGRYQINFESPYYQILETASRNLGQDRCVASVPETSGA